MGSQPTAVTNKAFLPPPLTLRSLAPLIVSCIGFGWIGSTVLPNRFFVSEGILVNLIPVALMAIPAVALSILGMFSFLKPKKIEWPAIIGALLFTMTLGLILLLNFYRLAESSQAIDNRHYGKLTPFVYAVKTIGWAGNNMGSSNLFQRLLTSIIHTGFCEEVTKLLPVFLIVLLNRKKAGIPDLKRLLLIGFSSGLGFGIGEALFAYSPWSGHTSIAGNVIRWFACVPLHGVYAVVDSALLWLLIPTFKEAKGTREAAGILVAAAVVIALVHGFYNTFASSSAFVAILCDGGAIILMVWLVKRCSQQEGNTNSLETQPLRLPGWMIRRRVGAVAYGRLYSIASAMILASFAFSSSMPSGSGTADDENQQSLIAETESEYRIQLTRPLFDAYTKAYGEGREFERRANEKGVYGDMRTWARVERCKQIVSSHGFPHSDSTPEFLFVYKGMVASGEYKRSALEGIEPMAHQ